MKFTAIILLPFWILTCLPTIEFAHENESNSALCPSYVKYSITVMNLNKPDQVLEQLEADCVVLLEKHNRYVAFEVHRLPKEAEPLSAKEKFDSFYFPALELPVSETTTIRASLKWKPEDR